MMAHQAASDRFESDDDLLTLRDAARIPNVHPGTIARKVRSGDLPACRLEGGTTVRVRSGDVRALLEPTPVVRDAS